MISKRQDLAALIVTLIVTLFVVGIFVVAWLSGVAFGGLL